MDVEKKKFGLHDQTMQFLPRVFVAEGPGFYQIGRAISDTEIIEAAKALLAQRFFRIAHITGDESARDFLMTQLAGYDHEVFAVVFLDVKLKVIAFEPMFRGTIDTTTVWPREVAKRALEWNASRVILAHNHPAGSTEPSKEDIRLTQLLKKSLDILGIQILDHIIIGGTNTMSFATAGLL